MNENNPLQMFCISCIVICNKHGKTHPVYSNWNKLYSELLNEINLNFKPKITFLVCQNSFSLEFFNSSRLP